jgi:hypothetical protein
MKKELMQGMIDTAYKADIPVETMTDEVLLKIAIIIFPILLLVRKMARRKARDIFYGEQTR